MLKTETTTNTTVTIDIIGKSIIDEKDVVQFAAHIDPEEDRLSISTVILDKDAYCEQCQDDEAEFDDIVCEAQNQIMDKYEEIVGLVQPDNDGGDSDDDDDDTKGPGDEETIVP